MIRLDGELVAVFGDCSSGDQAAGVVREYVDRFVPSKQGFGERAHLVERPEVGDEGGAAHRVSDSLGAFGVAADNGHVCASLRQRHCGLAPQPRAGSRDDDGLALKVGCHVASVRPDRPRARTLRPDSGVFDDTPGILRGTGP